MTPRTFEDLFHQFEICTRCDAVSGRIKELRAGNGFRYHWNPCQYGEPPFALILLAYEPSYTAVEQADQRPEEGGFNEPLRFAIEHFLLRSDSDSYYITNMAKCSIKGRDAEATRDRRFRTCEWALREELSLARALVGQTQFVSIGWAPLRFIKQNQNQLWGGFFSNRAVDRITHYSPRCEPHFRRFSRVRATEYTGFVARIRNEYETFLRLQCPGYFERLITGERDIEVDLRRLFKWWGEMDSIRRGRPAGPPSAP